MDKLKMSFEYGVSPIWISLNDSFFENYEPDDIYLMFSKELVQGILQLNNIFQSTINDDYPPDSEFSVEQKIAFKKIEPEVRDKLSNESKGRFELIWKVI